MGIWQGPTDTGKPATPAGISTASKSQGSQGDMAFMETLKGMVNNHNPHRKPSMTATDIESESQKTQKTKSL